MNVQGIAYVALGVLACFSGYSMFRSLLPLWGFLIVGWLAMTIVPLFVQVPAAQSLLVRIASFIIGGLVGAAIAIPLYYVIVFISGAALGALVGIIAGALFEVGGINSFASLEVLQSMVFPPQPNTPLQFIFMVVLGVIFGGLALSFQKFMITASSAFIGAAGVVGGLSGAIANGRIASNMGILVVMAWFLLGFIGLFIQYRFGSDEV
mgnify:CR=1 FL=1